MTDLIRIVYISRATFPVTELVDGVESNVTHILNSSRTNNRRAGIVGMLYYGDGHFFQCLEGETSKVQALYRTLLKDARHRDLKILASDSIKRLSFPDWAMKYVPANQHMGNLLEEHGFERFDPYRFDHYLIERVMQLMQGVPDPTVPTVEGRASAPARTFSTSTPTQPEHACNNGGQTARLSLALSIVALAVSAIALLLVLTRL